VETDVQQRPRISGNSAGIGPNPAPYDYSHDPELAKRVRSLGLEQNVQELIDVGFTVITGIEPDLTARLRAAILASPNKAVERNLAQDPVWVEAITHPKLLAISEVAVGKGFLISQMAGGIKPRGGGVDFALHADQGWWPAPFPEHTQFITFCWVTDDGYSCLEGGPTKVVPGTHKLRRHPTPDEVKADAGVIPIIAPVSSVTVWRGETWHGSFPRELETGERVTAHISYCRLSARPIEDYSEFANEEWLKDKPPVMRTLFGLDDFLGKGLATRLPLIRPTFRTARA